MTAGSHIKVAKVLEAPELSGEVERAVWQVEKQLRKEDEAALKVQGNSTTHTGEAEKQDKR